jgi:hypothetical protein
VARREAGRTRAASEVAGCSRALGVGADGHLNAQVQARRITVVLLDKYNPEFDGDRAKDDCEGNAGN